MKQILITLIRKIPPSLLASEQKRPFLHNLTQVAQGETVHGSALQNPAAATIWVIG
jgi:hypothetical protein